MSERRDTLGRRIGNAGVPRNTKERAGALEAKRAVLGTRGVLGDDARTAVSYVWCARRANGTGCDAYHVAPLRARVRESFLPDDARAPRWPLRVAPAEGTRSVVLITVRQARARFDTYRVGKRDAWAERERARIARRLDPYDAPRHVAHTCPPTKRDATRDDAPRYGAPAAHAGTCTIDHYNDAQRAACDRIRDAARRHRLTVYRDTVTRIALRDDVCVHA